MHEEANYCHETRPIARILSPFPPRANRGNPPRLFWSRTRVTVRPISLLVSKECLAEVYASRRFRFRCGLHPSFLLFFFFLISAVSRWITRHLWAKIEKLNVLDSNASTIYLPRNFLEGGVELNDRQGSNKMVRRTNKDAYVVPRCTKIRAMAHIIRRGPSGGSKKEEA